MDWYKEGFGTVLWVKHEISYPHTPQLFISIPHFFWISNVNNILSCRLSIER